MAVGDGMGGRGELLESIWWFSGERGDGCGWFLHDWIEWFSFVQAKYVRDTKG